MSTSLPPPEQAKGYTPGYIYGMRERSGCLTLWLLVASAASVYNIIGFAQVLNFVSEYPELQEHISGAFIAALAALVVTSIAGVWGMWNWKRWGVYLVGLTGIGIAALEFAMGVGTLTDIIQPVILVAILVWLVKSSWEYFE